MTATTGRKLPKPANGLVSRDLGGGEFVVLNTATNDAHSLQGASAVVWRAACDGTWPALPEDQIKETVEALTSLGLLAAPPGITRRSALKMGGGLVVATGIISIGLPEVAAHASVLHGTVAFNLHDEVSTYNSTHTSNSSSSHGTPDFTFSTSSNTNNGGGSLKTWTTTDLETTLLTYFASSTTNGLWANAAATTQPIVGPFLSSPFNGVSATPKAENGGGQAGTAAVAKVVLPSPPSGSYVTGATLTVQAQTTSGDTTGSSAPWLYIVSAGTSGTATTNLITPVQVTSAGYSNTFSLGTAVADSRYYVAIEDTDSTTTVLDLQISASLPWSN